MVFIHFNTNTQWDLQQNLNNITTNIDGYIAMEVKFVVYKALFAYSKVVDFIIRCSQ